MVFGVVKVAVLLSFLIVVAIYDRSSLLGFFGHFGKYNFVIKAREKRSRVKFVGLKTNNTLLATHVSLDIYSTCRMCNIITYTYVYM